MACRKHYVPSKLQVGVGALIGLTETILACLTNFHICGFVLGLVCFIVGIVMLVYLFVT